MSVVENVTEPLGDLSKRADECIEVIAASKGDRSVVLEQLRLYLQCRFVLEEEDLATDDLTALASKSIERLLQRYGNEGLKDLSSGCMGESSAVTKRILFVMTLRRKLGIAKDVEGFGAASTIDQLADAVCRALPS